MESHPVPKDVTNFQFKLVGDMTVKQFVYLASGVIVAYIVFISFSQKVPLIAWPIVLLSAGSGAAFAFLPLSNRPLDHWVAAFFKAIYSPTKMVWVKNNKAYHQEPLFDKRLQLLYSQSSIPQPEPVQPTPQPQVPVQAASSLHPAAIPPVPAPLPRPEPPKNLPSKEDLAKTVELAKEAQTLQTQIIETQKELNQLKTNIDTQPANTISYTQQLNTIFDNLQDLMQEAGKTRDELAKITHTPTPPVIKQPVKVTVVAPREHVQTQIVLTTLPNVINGIIKDSVGNLIEGVVVVIYDKEGLPVRALKTNKLGQFSGSTPLPNSTYKIELEKEGYHFDMLQIELEGKTLPPLFITAGQA